MSLAVLHEAGAQAQHMAHDLVHHRPREHLAQLKELGRVYRDIVGRHYPAMSCVQVSALMEERAKVEIEVTAVLPDPAPAPQAL